MTQTEIKTELSNSKEIPQRESLYINDDNHDWGGSEVVNTTTNTAVASWGYHLIIDAKGCTKNFDKPEVLKTFLNDLLVRIDMNAWGEPWITHFAEKPEIAGWTVIQALTTSSLTIHFLDNSGDCYFDLFSCKTFDIEMVKTMIKEYFDPISMKDQYLVRQA
jgi:S-adenosylmethionine decarboxylase